MRCLHLKLPLWVAAGLLTVSTALAQAPVVPNVPQEDAYQLRALPPQEAQEEAETATPNRYLETEFLKERGIGVLITDHNVRETLGICDHAYIISEGRVLAQGTPAASATGRSTRNPKHEPLPTSLSTQTMPPIRSTSRCVIARPSPVPSNLRLVSAST